MEESLFADVLLNFHVLYFLSDDKLTILKTNLLQSNDPLANIIKETGAKEGKSLYLMPPCLSTVLCKTLDALKTQQPIEQELYLEHLGEWFTAKHIPYSGTTIITAFFNITPLKKEKLEKEKLLRELDTLYKLTPGGLCKLNREYRCMRVNDEMAKMNGIQCDDHVGKKIHDVFPSSLVDQIVIPSQKVIQSGHPCVDLECRVFLPSDPSNEHVFVFSIYPIMDSQNSGNVEELAVVMKDYTEARTKDKLLQAKKKEIEEVTQAKSLFITRMSHELRTPVSCILGMADILADGEVTPDQLDCVVSIKHSAKMLLNHLNDFLDISKAEAGKLSIENAPFDLLEEVEKVIESCSMKAAEKHLKLLVHFDLTVHRYYRGDRLRVQQIILNLVGNAIRFTMRGHVLVRVKSGGEKESCNIIIEVQDTGIGIPEEFLEKVFEEFMQIDTSTSRIHSGTGLGLTVARNLAKLMNGNISVESELGKGSIFRVSLSLEPTVAIISTSSSNILDFRVSTNFAKNKNIKILILGVDSVQIGIVHSYLRELGIENITESDDLSSLSQDFDVVIIDCESLEITKLVTSLRSNMKILFITLLGQRLFFRSVSEQIHITARIATKPLKPSSFVFCLHKLYDSIVVVPEEAAIMKKKRKRTFSNLKVLLVEDNPLNKKIACRLLEQMECSVTTAKNGAEAVEKVKKESFDIAIMDCQMPVMDGYEATRIIREMEAETKTGVKQHLPIIALTAHALLADKQHCLSSGMDDYLIKPIDAQMLENIFVKLTSSKRR